MTDYAGHIYSATYDFFYTESEAFNYTLRLGEYSGNAGKEDIKKVFVKWSKTHENIFMKL